MSTPKNASIILTYRGKVLLKFKEENLIAIQSAIWEFVHTISSQNQSPHKSIAELVRRDMGIKLSDISEMPDVVLENSTDMVYVAKLTDDQVNSMNRKEGLVLSFFSLSELEKIPLTKAAKQLLENNKHQIQKVASLA